MPALPDALQGVEDVPWAALSHAYGPATDVPELLRGAASDDDEARSAAVGELFGTVWHQGTVYSATAHAVPFLARIVADTAVAGRAEVATLLAAIAGGTGYLEVHREIGHRDVDDDPTVRERERAWVIAAHQAVRDQLDVLLGLTEDPDVEVRRVLPTLLARCGRDDERVADRLLAWLSREPDAHAAASVVLALGDIEDSTGRIVASIEKRAVSDEPAVMFAGSLVRAARTDSGTERARAIAALADAASHEGVDFEALAWDHDGGAIGLLLSAFPDRPASSLELLAAMAAGPAAGLRTAAVMATGDLIRTWRVVTPDAVTRLADLAAGSDPKLARTAMIELRNAFPACAPAADQIAALLHQPTGRACEDAAITLARLHDARAWPLTKEAVEAPVLADWAADALRAYGSSASAVLPKVLSVLPRLDTRRRVGEPRSHDNRAAALIAWIATLEAAAEPAIPLLAKRLRHGDLAAASALATLGRRAAPARKAIIDAFRAAQKTAADPSRRRSPGTAMFVSHCAAALWHIDSDPEPLLTVVRAMLGVPGGGTALCMKYLPALGPAAAPALDLVETQTHAVLPWARIYALRTIYRITNDPDSILTPLISEIGPTQPGISALELLHQTGQPATEALRRQLHQWLHSKRRLGGKPSGTVSDIVERDETFCGLLRQVLDDSDP